MKLKRLILLSAGCASALCAAASPQVDRAAGRSRACDAQEPAAGALMALDHTAYDFGTVLRKGGDLVHEFPFTNEGTAPLVVVRVVTSCSCLKATYPKRPVAPGESATIRIVYEPHKSEPGAFSKVVRIYSNSAGGRDLVTVQGNSVDAAK